MGFAAGAGTIPRVSQSAAEIRRLNPAEYISQPRESTCARKEEHWQRL
jgi:hypothetical protein